MDRSERGYLRAMHYQVVGIDKFHDRISRVDSGIDRDFSEVEPVG